jgi:DNA modification methylase
MAGLQIMTIHLMQGDCLELMKEIPDASVDMILCDLPYGEVNQKSSGLRLLSRTERFDENRLRFAKPVFFMSKLLTPALTNVNDMETIP